MNIPTPELDKHAELMAMLMKVQNSLDSIEYRVKLVERRLDDGGIGPASDKQQLRDQQIVSQIKEILSS